MFRKLSALALALAFAGGASLADDVKVGALEISAPWARATPKGASIGGGYLKITNTGAAPDRLIGGSSPISDKLEVHEMSMSGGVMKMRPVSGGLEVKPGGTIELKPGGLHIMFVGLKQPLQQGQHFKATLQFEKAGKIEVDFSVAGIGATGAAMPDMGGMKMK
jgi:hypothetical protein